jgi:DNA-binding XRE family transcriptional regulator
MNAHTQYSRVVGSDGKTHYYLVPVEDFQRLLAHTKQDEQVTIPNAVVKLHLLDELSVIAAWRTYLGLTQEEVAHRLNISQAAYCQMEKAKRPRQASRKRVAQALGLDEQQLSF